jgi:hypothetical protein
MEKCHKILSSCTEGGTLRCFARGVPAARRRYFSHRFSPPLLLAPLLGYNLKVLLQVVLALDAELALDRIQLHTRHMPMTYKNQNLRHTKST